jgi:hypothetical protein
LWPELFWSCGFPNPEFFFSFQFWNICIDTISCLGNGVGRVARACNPRTWEAKVEGSWVLGQVGLHREVQTSVGYMAWPCLKPPKIIINKSKWWLTPVILATWEAEIRGIVVQG